MFVLHDSPIRWACINKVHLNTSVCTEHFGNRVLLSTPQSLSISSLLNVYLTAILPKITNSVLCVFHTYPFTLYQSTNVENPLQLIEKKSLHKDIPSFGTTGTWTEAWETYFRQRISTKATMPLGRTRCTSISSNMDIGAMSKELMMQHQSQHIGIFQPGKRCQAALHPVLEMSYWATSGTQRHKKMLERI